jgi:imidazole glycerol-phosphate synthase subunit HisH
LIAIFDYGSGNLRSAERAFSSLGVETVISSDFDLCLDASGLVVPGVGAFGTCMAGIRALRGDELIARRIENSLPTLGICVGMQVLFDKSSEDEQVSGLEIWPGELTRLNAPIVPHMGWSGVDADSSSQLFDGIANERFYFVHSYAVKKLSPQLQSHGVLATWSNYSEPFLAAVESPALVATQFHPEKSGQVGLKLLDNWLSNWLPNESR